jgi:hypothetical protein
MAKATPEQIEAWDRLEQEFRTEGFLAPSSSTIVEHAHSEMTDWFALARDLNRLAQSFYVDATGLLIGRHMHEPLCMGLQLMPRALAAFQGSIILLERAMVIEASTLTRAIFETAFWIGYLHVHGSEAAEQLRHETLKSEIGLMRTSLTAMPHMDEDQRVEVQRRIQEMEPMRDALPASPSIQEVAKRGGFGAEYIHYRLLSNTAAHASLKSTLVYLGKGEDGEFTGHEIGPDFDGAGEAMYQACYALITAVEALRRLTNRPDIDDEFSKVMGRFHNLPPYEQKAVGAAEPRAGEPKS